MTERRARNFELIRSRLALLVCLLGASLVIGGLSGWHSVLSWLPTLAPASPVAGIVSIVIGSALMASRGSRSARLLALLAVVGSIAVAIAAAADRVGSDAGSTSLSHGFWVMPRLPGAIGLILAAAGCCFWAFERPLAAQAAAIGAAGIGGLALLSILYGDRTSSVAASQFPGTAVSAPGATVLVVAGFAVLVGTAGVGVSGWLMEDGPGRVSVRRLLPPGVLIIVLIAGFGRWFGLDERLGEARARAITAMLIMVVVALVAIAAVRVIDRYSEAARHGELAEMRLAAALRSAGIADLARALAGASTPEQVSVIVNDFAPRILGAEAASVGILDRPAGVIRIQHGTGVSADLQTAFATPSIDAPLALAESIRRGARILISDPAEHDRRYPVPDEYRASLPAGSRATLPLMDRNVGVVGALAIGWPMQIDFDDDITATLNTMVELVSHTFERVRLSEAVAGDARRTADLARLAEHLATAATTPDVVEYLTRYVTAPLEATTAVIGLIDPDTGVVRRHFSPKVAEPWAAFISETGAEEMFPLVESATTGATIILGSRDDVLRRYPESLDGFDAAGFYAMAFLSLRDRSGRSFGSLGLGWHQQVDLDGPLMYLLSTVVDVAGQTLERAGLSDEQDLLTARAAGLASLAGALALATQDADVVESVERYCADALGCDSAVLVRTVDGVTSDGVTLDAPGQGERGVEQRVVTPNPEISLSATEEEGELDMGIGPQSDQVGLQDAARATVPIRDQTGRLLGVLTLRWSRKVRDDVVLRSSLSTVGVMIGQTLERVELADAEHRLVDGLQRRIMRPPLGIAGLDAAAWYEPASHLLGMGGDWYETVEPRPGSLGLVVGDVVGHGTDATVEMLQLSRLLSSLLLLEVPMEGLFQAAHRALGATPIFATAFVGMFEPDQEIFHYVVAGHPPPILVRPDGQATLLEGGRHPMLGIESTRSVSASVHFPPGSMLVVYTDGLVERRTEDIAVGFERLRAHCAAAIDRSPEELVRSLIDSETRDRSIEDDIAVVAVRSTQSSF